MSTIPDYKTLVALLRDHDSLFTRARAAQKPEKRILVGEMSKIQGRICEAIPKPTRRDRLHDGHGYRSNLDTAVGSLIVGYDNNALGAAPAIARILQLKDAP